MDIWTLNKYSSFFESIDAHQGIRCRYQSGINSDLKKIIATFITWIRERFSFPIRVNVYFMASRYIKAQDGEKVNGTFWEPDDYSKKPYIKVACGIDDNSKVYCELIVLETLAHEITHYYQWVNRLKKSERQLEYQAVWYSHRIIEEFVDDLANNNNYQDDPVYKQLIFLLKTGDGSVS